MKLAHIALVSVIALGVSTIGCKRDEDDDASGEQLGTSEAQLVEDDSEANDTDEDLEAGLDEPLSGATETDPGAPADGSDDEVAERGRLNPGRFFKPAGCIVSTREGFKVKHVFNGCRGPYDMAEFNGTITTTFTREAGKLTITHEAEGFTANGASISGKRVVVYTREGSVVTKTRTGNWSGTTGKGKPISHQADFVTTWDAATKCITRDGTATTTIGGRTFERVVADYKRCGIGRGGCPESGTIRLTRTKGGESLSLSLEFLGGVRYRVTRPNGKQVTRLLVCRPNAG